MKPLFFLLICGLIISCGNDQKNVQSTKIIPRDSIAIANKVTDVIAIGKVQPDSGIVNLSSSKGGMVTGKFIGEGDTVYKDEVLMQLRDVDQRNQAATLKGQMETLKQQIESDKLELNQYKIKLADKEKTLATSQALVKDGAETPHNVQSLQTEIALLNSNLINAKQKIKIGESQLQELKTQFSQATGDIADRKLRAPANGKLIDVDVEKGEVLQAYTSYASLIPLGHLVVWGEADELFANKVHDGQRVYVKYIGYPDTVAQGTISYASPVLKSKSLFSDEPGEKQDRLVRRFKVKLEDEPELLINAKVQCIIKLGSDVADSL